MLRGFYTAATGMYAQQRKTEMLTNNLANVQTPGYKADQATMRSFPEMLLREFKNDFKSRNVGELHTGVYVQETIPNFVQGDMRETSQPTDLAIIDQGENKAFFTVREGEDIRYTRNGSFQVSPEGILTTGEGFPVLNTAGNPMNVTSDQFTINETGMVEENGVVIGQLAIASTDTPEQLVKIGNGLFRTENNEPLPEAELTSIVSQGFIEGSTVDTAKTMTDMMVAYRMFEANQKIIQAYDRSLEKAVNEVGRIG